MNDATVSSHPIVAVQVPGMPLECPVGSLASERVKVLLVDLISPIVDNNS